MNIIDQITVNTVSDTAYVYTSAINLTRSRYERENVFLKADVNSGKATASFDINAIWCQTSGGTYTPFITGSGSSKLITAGTSGALYAAGSYFVPITITPHSGITIPFEATGWLKLGTKSTNGDFNLNLIIGV